MSAEITHDVIAIGESLALLGATESGRFHRGAALRLSFGGAESNVAIGVARLGGNAAWLGRVGTDTLGDLILRELRAEGVTSYAIRDPDTATALMIKERPTPGRSRISYYRRHQAGSRLTAADIDRGAIASARILHVTGITPALSASASEAITHAIDYAKTIGRVVSFDINHRDSLWADRDRAQTTYRGLAARADLIFAGSDEAALIVGTDDLERQASALLELGEAAAVIIKLGADGAFVATRDSRVHRAKAVPVEVVDTVGAGDAFVAGWLAEYARNADVNRCLTTAIACGAFACTGAGDWESLPVRADLELLHGTGNDPVQR
ncbi:MAG: sugar kinase [Gordonia sp. (in: high G+C Gram-positive bacteria)]